MDEPEPTTLADELTTTLQQLDTLIARHQEGQNYAATLERLAWLHQLTCQLQQELALLKATALADTASPNGAEGATIWRNVCAELRASQPPAFRSPARALIEAHIDLLRLVEYISTATALVRQQRAILTERNHEYHE
jgi:hypothetical protein